MLYDKHSDVILLLESIDENKFISNSTDKNIILWEVETAEVLKIVSLADDVPVSLHYEKDLDLLIFAALDGKLRAVELSPEIEEVKAKYTIDQGSPIFFCV